MVYKKNFVAAVKINGKILRESGETISVPFDSEYSLLLKNLEAVRAQAKITIDGRDVGGWFVLQPNSDLEIERFVTDLVKGNKFKFIERSESVEQARGIQADDGLIRIEYKRERVNQNPLWIGGLQQPYYAPITIPSSGFILYAQNNSYTPSITGMRSGTGASSVVCNQVNTTTCPIQNSNQQSGDVGITVEGGRSNQKFYTTYDFACEPSEVITIQLKGHVGKAITVDAKPKCKTCNRQNKATNKFCSNCGTSLEIV